MIFPFYKKISWSLKTYKLIIAVIAMRSPKAMLTQKKNLPQLSFNLKALNWRT